MDDSRPRNTCGIIHAHAFEIAPPEPAETTTMIHVDGPNPDPASARPTYPTLSGVLRRAASWLLRCFCSAAVVLNVLGLVGHFARGRAIWLEVLLYFPLVPLGLMAILAGMLAWGLGARKGGPAIVLLGVASVGVYCWWMIGRGPLPTQLDVDSRQVVRLLHWNVLWGGLDSAGGGWASIVDEIAERTPDIIVLSETAPAPSRRQLLDRLGVGWSEIAAESQPRVLPYKYGIVVLSRWPMKFAGVPPVRNGTACEVIVDHPSRPIRVLAVDGQSLPMIPRTPMLGDIAAICDRAAEAESGPIDIVAGDFNCVGRSRGFDMFRAAGGGYSMASQSSSGCRATWPSWLPIYDIDHVWVRGAIAIRSCTLFKRFASDHRGQLVELVLPSKP